MNRNDLKEYFARLKRGHHDAFVGNTTKPTLLREQQDPNQTGEFTPEEYILSEIIVAAWEAGARWASGEPTIQADRAAADLEDAIADAGLAIPPMSEKTKSDLEKLYKSIEGKKSRGSYDDSFSQDMYSDKELQAMSGEGLDALTQDIPDVDLDYGGFEEEEDALDNLRNPSYDDDSEDDDPIRRMGFPDYQSTLEDEDEDTEDDFSPEYRRMVSKGRYYDK